MDMVRLFKVRGVVEVSREGGFVEQKLCDVTHTPVTNMNRLKASSVCMGICPLVRKDPASILIGARVDVCICEREPGVEGDVAEGIVYESMTSIRLRVIVAMMGCRLDVALIVLKVYFRSSCPGGNVGESCEEVDMPETRRECAGFSTQRALRVRP
jgi:hypothetical protein